jgi:hypothetical protein
MELLPPVRTHFGQPGFAAVTTPCFDDLFRLAELVVIDKAVPKMTRR